MAKANSKPEYTIRRAEQLAALVSPIRVRILDVAAQLGVSSIAEIADALGRRPSTLYRHVAALEQVGLLKPEGYRKASKHEEALYRAPAPVIRISDATRSTAMRDTLARVFSAMLRDADRMVRRWVLSGRNQRRGRFRRAFVLQTTGWLTPEERHRADELAGELFDLVTRASHRRSDEREQRDLEQTTVTVATFPRGP